MLVEQDIAHLSRVMRAFVFRRGGAITGYWQNRLDVLSESRRLNDYQRHWVQELMRELQELSSGLRSTASIVRSTLALMRRSLIVDQQCKESSLKRSARSAR